MKCASCKVEKQLDQFEKRSDTGKHRSQCKECRKLYVNQYRRDIVSGSREKKYITVVDNKKQCIKCREFKDLSQFPKRDTKHGYRHECKDCKRQIMNKYYDEVYNEVRRNKKQTDIEYRLMCNHRNYIHKCLTKFTKTSRSLVYLGCTLTIFKNWLEYQFDVDMTWDNYGTYWTVDHVLPLDLFNLDNIEHQNIAFNWKNTRPVTDNSSKGNKLQLYSYFNVLVSAHRFIQKHHLDKCEYQSLNKSLDWLRETLRYGKNLIDKRSSDLTIVMKNLKIDNPHPSSSN